ncbi:MAG: glycosyltransferase family 2 protein [Rhodothermales bacterium]|nr:glycosyltransferase family 2 protein [Rhodothermales bacterium]
MKLVLTLLVRDEADLLAENLAHHFDAGVDFVVATDNGSRDGTAEILRAYERAGRLEYHYQPPADFAQHAWVTRMARRAAAVHGADWVINGDADEFFVPASGTLKDVLRRLPAGVDVVLVPRRNFVPCERPRRRPPPVEMVYHAPGFIAPKAVHRGVPDVTVWQGNHGAESPRLRLPARPCPGIIAYHYPIRSLAQFETKVWNGGSGYDLNDTLHPELGHHKRRWYRLLLAGALPEEYARLFMSRDQLCAALDAGTLQKDLTLRTRLLHLGPAAVLNGQ